MNFIFEWGNNNREMCWSGTPYGIFKSISSYTAINDIEIPQRFMHRIRSVINRFVYGNDFNIASTLEGEKYINKRGECEIGPNLVFLEYNAKCIKDTYIYQDCSVDYIIRLKNQGEDFARFSPLPSNVNQRGIAKRREMTRQFYDNCKGIFTMSNWLADDLINHSGIPEKKVHVIGAGCNIDYNMVDASQKTGKRFLFVGKDWHRKNGPLVVKAFQKLREKYDYAELFVAGPQIEPDEIRNVEGIYFLGQKTYSEMVEYYNRCDFFVMPSQFEPYGIVFAEALIFGLPCIGKNAFAMKDFIKPGENGYLITNDNPEELAQNMEELLRNKEMAIRVIEEKEKYIEQYSWDAVAQRMLAVMKNDGYSI